MKHAQKREWKRGYLERLTKYTSLMDVIIVGNLDEALKAHRGYQTIEDGKPGAVLTWMPEKIPPSDTVEIHGKVRSLSKPDVSYKMRTTLRRTRKFPNGYGIGRIAEDIIGAEHEEAQYFVTYGWKSVEKETIPGRRPQYYPTPTHSQIMFTLGLQEQLPDFSEEKTGVRISLLDYYPKIEPVDLQAMLELMDSLRNEKAEERIDKLYKEAGRKEVRWFNTPAFLTKLV